MKSPQDARVADLPALGRTGNRVARRVRTSWRLSTNDFRSLPSFLIIGVQKGGTTSLYNYLSQHPDIRPAIGKGIHYFDQHLDAGDQWYRSRFPAKVGPGRRPLTGEAAPSYFPHPHVPARVAKLLPNVKLIAMLRDPVKRANSHYQHNRRMGREPLSFEQAILHETKRTSAELDRMLVDPSYESWSVRHYSYVRKGLYAAHLERWLEHFSEAQLLVLRSEDLYGNPAAVTDEVFRFLGVRPWALSRFDAMNAGGDYVDIPSDTEAELREYYAPHNELLHQLIGTEFNWE